MTQCTYCHDNLQIRNYSPDYKLHAGLNLLVPTALPRHGITLSLFCDLLQQLCAFGHFFCIASDRHVNSSFNKPRMASPPY